MINLRYSHFKMGQRIPAASVGLDGGGPVREAGVRQLNQPQAHQDRSVSLPGQKLPERLNYLSYRIYLLFFIWFECFLVSFLSEPDQKNSPCYLRIQSGVNEIRMKPKSLKWN